MELKWENPAPAKGRWGVREWPQIVEALKARPGVWALVREDAPASISKFLKEKYGLEVTVRDVKASRGKIYARWPEEK